MSLPDPSQLSFAITNYNVGKCVEYIKYCTMAVIVTGILSFVDLIAFNASISIYAAYGCVPFCVAYLKLWLTKKSGGFGVFAALLSLAAMIELAVFFVLYMTSLIMCISGLSATDCFTAKLLISVVALGVAGFLFADVAISSWKLVGSRESLQSDMLIRIYHTTKEAIEYLDKKKEVDFDEIERKQRK